MKYYRQLVDLGSFSRRDIVALTGSEEVANSIKRTE